MIPAMVAIMFLIFLLALAVGRIFFLNVVIDYMAKDIGESRRAAGIIREALIKIADHDHVPGFEAPGLVAWMKGQASGIISYIDKSGIRGKK